MGDIDRMLRQLSWGDELELRSADESVFDIDESTAKEMGRWI